MLKKENNEKKNFFKVRYNHWFNQKEFSKDYNYTENIFWQTCSDLKQILNEYHNLNLTTKSWSILLFPWLYEYTSVIYDRWLYIINQKKQKNYEFKKKNIYLKKSKNFFYLSQNKDWNNYQYYKIQKFLSKETYKKKNFFIKKKNFFLSEILIRTISILRIFNIFLIDKNNIFVDNNPFETKKSFKTFYNSAILKLIKKVNEFLFELYDYNINERLRLKKIINKKKSLKGLSFKNFFLENIAFDLPCEIIEGFKIHLKKRIKIPRSKNIYSSYSHFDNFNFKICFSELIQNNCKINILEHGGGLPHKGMNFEFEEKVYSKKYVWFKRHNLNQQQFLNENIKNEYHNISENLNSLKDRAIIILNVYPKYFAKMAFAKHNFNYVDELSFFNKFLKDLPKKKQKKIYLKPHPSSDHRYYLDPTLDLLSKNKYIKIIYKKENFKDVLKKNKLIICTSYETTFNQSMLSGTPTILLMNMKNFSMHPKVKKIFRELVKAKIIFTEPSRASKHVNEIINDPLKWYNSKKIQNIRNNFLKSAFNLKT